MELFAFTVMLIVTNAFFMIREITIVVNHNHEEDKTPYEVADFILSIIGIVGAIICTVLVLLISRPVYSNMREDVFLRIGGNRNVWGKTSTDDYFCSRLQVLYSVQIVLGAGPDPIPRFHAHFYLYLV
jgi:hypothetical protein